jgi:hypothetical protein
MSVANPITFSIQSRLERVKARPPKGRSPKPADRRPSQWPPNKEILVHDCFDQRAEETKQQRCGCKRRITFVEARALIERDLADWLIVTRNGKKQQNRYSLVLTAECIKKKAHSEDALNHKLGLSITSSEDYYIAPERMQSGIDREIEAVRLGTIRERGREVESRRKHRVGIEKNFRRGDGGVKVGFFGKEESSGNWKNCNGPDSDELRSFDETLPNGGQSSSKKGKADMANWARDAGFTEVSIDKRTKPGECKSFNETASAETAKLQEEYSETLIMTGREEP